MNTIRNTPELSEMVAFINSRCKSNSKSLKCSISVFGHLAAASSWSQPKWNYNEEMSRIYLTAARDGDGISVLLPVHSDERFSCSLIEKFVDCFCDSLNPSLLLAIVDFDSTITFYNATSGLVPIAPTSQSPFQTPDKKVAVRNEHTREPEDDRDADFNCESKLKDDSMSDSSLREDDKELDWVSDPDATDWD